MLFIVIQIFKMHHGHFQAYHRSNRLIIDQKALSYKSALGVFSLKGQNKKYTVKLLMLVTILAC